MSALQDQAALVTGGGSGIGAAIALLFAREGADVAVLDRDEQHAAAVAEESGSFGGRTTAITVDVTDGEAVQQAMARVVEELGGIDVLVSAAGILDETPLLEMTEATFDKVLAVDLKGVFLAARWAAPHMVERGGGRIINIASQLGIKGGTGLTHYVAAKAGVIGMTKAMALELAEHRILVNSIAPGPVVTPLIEGLSEEWKAAKQAELPIGRFGQAHEVAPTALLLASSPGGDLYTGQTLGPNSGDVMP